MCVKNAAEIRRSSGWEPTGGEIRTLTSIITQHGLGSEVIFAVYGIKEVGMLISRK